MIKLTKKQKIMNKVVYRHLKPNGEVFYIGIGTLKRAYKKGGRSQLWQRTVDKYGYEVQILKSNLSWEEACELECILIDYYGRRNLGTGSLVNMTDGGDGSQGYKLTDEHKEILSNIMKSNKNPAKNMSKEHLERIKLANKGKRKGHILSEETKRKISEAKKGKKTYGDHPQAKAVINKETGEIYSTIKEVAELLNMEYGTLCAQLTGRNPNKTNFELLKKGDLK